MRFLPHMDQGPGPDIPAPSKEDDGDEFPARSGRSGGAVGEKPRKGTRETWATPHRQASRKKNFRKVRKHRQNSGCRCGVGAV